MPTTMAMTAAATACERLATILEQAMAMEDRSRATGDDAIRVPLVRYALGIVRMRLRPALEPGWVAADPAHVAMFGGTNSGKSTVLNVLLGRPAAGMSYRARFSQHPEGYRPLALGDHFLDAFPSRFAGYARYHDRHPPRQDDHELHAVGYRPALAINDPARLPGPVLADPATDEAVFWDIPDFSTEEAMTYMSAVLDTIALADLVVMAVTKENYADHRGALLRAMIVESGVPLRVVANKLEDGSALLEDIRFKIGGDGPEARRVPADRIHPLPHVFREGEDDRLAALLASPRGRRLAEGRGRRRGPHGADLKVKALQGAMHFLDRRLDDLLAPLRAEVSVSEHWASIVDADDPLPVLRTLSRRLPRRREVRRFQPDARQADGPAGDPRNRAVYLGPEPRNQGDLASRHRHGPRPRPPRLRQAEDRTEEAAGGGSRHQCLRAVVQHAQGRGPGDGRPRRASRLGPDRSPARQPGVLRSIPRRAGLRLPGLPRPDGPTSPPTRAQVLYEIIQKNPRLLNTLRGIKVSLDVGTTGLIVASHGLDWTDAVIGPLVAPVQRLILEFGLEKYLDTERQRLKQDQFAAFREIIDAQMVAPVRALFEGSVRPEELSAARRDLDAVRSALARVGEGVR